jgi:hypothetical protein
MVRSRASTTVCHAAAVAAAVRERNRKATAHLEGLATVLGAPPSFAPEERLGDVVVRESSAEGPDRVGSVTGTTVPHLQI